MRSIRIAPALALFLAVLFGVTFGTPGAALAGNRHSVTTDEARAAIAHVSSLLADADSSKTTADADSVAETPNMDIPRNPAAGVTFKGNGHGPDIKLTLPGSKSHGAGQLIAPGTVAYPSTDGSFTNVVQQLEGKKGGRIFNVIKSSDATEDYSYGIHIPTSLKAKAHLAEDGAVYFTDKNNNFVAAIAPPTATDAEGKKIAAKYTVSDDGKTLTNHVQHHVAGVTYPVVADPYLVWGWYKVDVLASRQETNLLMFGVTTGAIFASRLPGPYSWIIAAAGGVYAAWANYIYNQGGCMKFLVTYWGGLYAWYYYPWNHWYCR